MSRKCCQTLNKCLPCLINADNAAYTRGDRRRSNCLQFTLQGYKVTYILHCALLCELNDDDDDDEGQHRSSANFTGFKSDHLQHVETVGVPSVVKVENMR